MNPVERTILLVEDDPGDAALVEHAIQTLGFGVNLVVARDGTEALHVLRIDTTDPPPPIALVLLDLKLPKIHGLEVLRRIREDPRTRTLRVVILTSSFADEERLQAYTRGANGFVRKAIEFTEFRDAIRQIASYWLLVDVGPPSG